MPDFNGVVAKLVIDVRTWMSHYNTGFPGMSLLIHVPKEAAFATGTMTWCPSCLFFIISSSVCVTTDCQTGGWGLAMAMDVGSTLISHQC